MNSNSRLSRVLWHPAVRGTAQVVVYAGCLVACAIAVFLMLTGLHAVVSG